MFYVGNWISGPIDSAMYDCYLFVESVILVSKTKYLTFLNFADIYTSFLFNLLAQSL